ncbi:MAG: hypothetical protein MZV63_38590 [Marinilabiliales bacterium]|nr:hypothetical protein [Marinilabiliales bacterium]
MAAEKDALRISWSHPDPADVSRWVVYYKYGSQWNHEHPREYRCVQISSRHSRSTASILSRTDPREGYKHRTGAH